MIPLYKMQGKKFREQKSNSMVTQAAKKAGSRDPYGHWGSGLLVTLKARTHGYFTATAVKAFAYSSPIYTCHLALHKNYPYDSWHSISNKPPSAFDPPANTSPSTLRETVKG